ncbi:hypothetical protein PtA15_17A419 [Puccinia triticina]|uniref:Uncharacterized protein n=1 Tax=Puccinia triticina TaxID=208348 RepID=A0ABY7DD76_9BASI|nr:uncharacterized protein PtA15_17A419 [Puccinia triticina]WAQ92937.1 hypothetical protein PtA15_17A419 [Puccinia triticina]
MKRSRLVAPLSTGNKDSLAAQRPITLLENSLTPLGFPLCFLPAPLTVKAHPPLVTVAASNRQSLNSAASASDPSGPIPNRYCRAHSKV